MNVPTIDVLVAGKPARLAFDTGATNVLILPAAAERIGLTPGGKMIGSTSLGSTATLPITKPVQITIGGHASVPLGVVLVPALTMVPDNSGIDGLLGLEAMLPLEVDVDLPANQLTLFAAGTCPDGALRLPGRSMTFRSPANPHLQFTIQAKADGHDFSLIVDTGVGLTILSAAALGLGAADLASDRAIDVETAGADRGKATMHRVGRVEIGELVYQNAQFPVVPSIPFGFGGALGNDFWGDHRFWLSQATGTVTVALPQRSPSAR